MIFKLYEKGLDGGFGPWMPWANIPTAEESEFWKRNDYLWNIYVVGCPKM